MCILLETSRFMCRNYIYKKRKKCISHHRRRQQCHCTHLKRMPANAFIFGFRELFKLCITFHLLPFAIPIDDPIAFILSFSRKKNNINTHLQWFSWNLSTFFLSEFFFPIFLPSQLHIKRSIIIFFRQNIFIKTRISLVIDLFFSEFYLCSSSIDANEVPYVFIIAKFIAKDWSLVIER